MLQNKETTIEITENNRKDIKVILTHLYRKGFNTIRINNITTELLNEIKTVTEELLLGFEITEQSDDKCTIENISEPTEEKFDALFRRIFLIIKETQAIITKDFESNAFTHLKEIEEFNTQLDKFVLFCRRIVAKEKYEKNPIITWELLTFLTHIQHAHYYLYKYASENKIKTDKNMTYLTNSLKEYFDLYYEAYFRKDIKYIHKINQLKTEFHFGQCIKYLELSSGKNNVVHSYIREIFRIIQIGTSPLLSELIETEIK